MFVKRVCEIEALTCPQCGGQMKVIAFIEPPRQMTYVDEDTFWSEC